ncbi:MAG: helix-hairpin-helix domain-containing protein [Ignavibacteriae bacterium]|nr:helix-hairpin-helix domain-containing protein [Ignavibacteriota bacterium]
MKIKFRITIFILFNPIILFSQIDSSEILDLKIFELFEDFSSEDDDFNYYDLLENFIENPIDINSADKNELLKIPFLKLNDAKSILKTRKMLNEFTSIEDLNLVKDIHPDILMLLKLLVIVKPKNDKSAKTYFNNFSLRSRISNDLQERSGFTENKFSGNGLKNYNRIKFNYSDFSLGFLTEKDVGEKLFTDHYSGFLSYKNLGIVKEILVGDFNIEFGQGLAIWSPYSFSKSSDANNIIKQERNLVPHISSEENKFLRGIAIHSKLNNFEIKTFFSQNYKDASIDDFGNVTNFNFTGFHRTENEINNFENLKETTFGGIINYFINENLSLGISHVKNIFNQNLLFQNNFGLHGNKFSFTSFSYNLNWENLIFTGELSNNSKTTAIINNLFLDLSKSFQVSASYRNYPKEYYNIYSFGFGESSNTQNENGFYFGVKFNSDFGKINLYYDIFNFPYSNSLNGFSANGNDFLFNYENKILPNIKVDLKFKDEVKEIFIIENLEEKIDAQEKLIFRFTLDYNLSKLIFGKSRFEYVKFIEVKNIEEGYLLFQDLKLKIKNNISVSTRFIFFQTKSYNSRIYEFENDIKGVLNNLALFGEGMRIYFLIQYNPIDNLEIYFKYSETYKPNEKTLSSGYSEIIGNIDNKISAQIYFRF